MRCNRGSLPGKQKTNRTNGKYNGYASISQDLTENENHRNGDTRRRFDLKVTVTEVHGTKIERYLSRTTVNIVSDK